MRLAEAPDLQISATAEAIRADPTAPAPTYAYRFAGVLQARVPGGVWRPMRSAQPSGGGTLTGRTSEDFTAASPAP